MNQQIYFLDEAPFASKHDEYTNKINAPGGFSIGLGIFGGANYFLTDYLAIGVEFASAYQYVSVGGLLCQDLYSFVMLHATDRTVQSEEILQQWKLFIIQSGINLTVRF
jgi:hypothetical protein